MKIKNYILIIVLICLIGMIGCENKENMSIETETVPSSSPSPIHTRRPEQAYYPQIVINDSLLELDKEDFAKEYAKLPDDYEIEIVANVLYDAESEPISLNGESNTITKKQAEDVQEINYGDFETSFVLSLKGLRYFPNVKSIYFLEGGIIEMKELAYLSNLKNVCFRNCNLGTGESTDELKCLSGMKKLNLEMSGCKLKDINFLNDFPDLPEGNLCFSSNQITDIRPLSSLKNVKYLDLSNNQIKNIKPLLGLIGISELNLSFNKISNISPLANLKKIRVLWLAYNQVKSVSILPKLISMEVLDLTGNRIIDPSPLKNLKLKVAHRFGIENGYQEYTFTKLLDNSILDYSSVNNMLENYYFPKGKRGSNGELIYHTEALTDGKVNAEKILYEGTKHHFDMKILGIEYAENTQRQYTFFTPNATYDSYNKNNQPACNIIFFFEVLGGSGEYDKAKGILKCFYQGKTYLFHNYSDIVKVDNKEIRLQKEMKHMQGNQPFALVSDLCKLTNKKYHISKKRKMWQLNYDRMIKITVPSLVEVK